MNSIDGDGTLNGYDLDQLKSVSSMVDVPVIASGGAGTLAHLSDALEAGAHAVLAASIFHYSKYSIEEAKLYLRDCGNEVRMDYIQ